MVKKKTLKKHEFSIEDIPCTKLHDESKFSKEKSSDFFKNENEVAAVLFECLKENDIETFMEVLDAYLDVNRSKIAKKSKLSRSTVSIALSKKGNPTIKTIAKIIHEAVALRK